MYTHVYIYICVHKLAVSSPSCQHLRSLSRGATCRLRYMRAWRSLNLKSPSSSHVSTSVASDKLVQCKSTVTYIHTDICVHKIFICRDVYISIRNCFFIFPHLPASTHSGLRILERHFPWTPIRSSLELTNVEFVSSSEASTSIASKTAAIVSSCTPEVAKMRATEPLRWLIRPILSSQRAQPQATNAQ